MRLKLFVFLLGLFCLQEINASHVTAGTIQYKSLGNSQWYVSAYIVRDCNGIQYTTPTARIDGRCIPGGTPIIYTLSHVPFVAGPEKYGGPYGAIVVTATPTLYVQEISKVCDSLLNPKILPNTACRGGTARGYTLFKYGSIVTLPSCSNFQMGYSTQCCRNSLGSNMSTGSAYFESYINTTTNTGNSSPNFDPSQDLINDVCVGDTGHYSFAMTDPDGDSLTYSLTCPKGTSSSCVAFRSGYSATRPMNYAKLDSFTGVFSYMALNAGKKDFAILVNQYDANTKAWKGSTLHDLQFHAEICINKAPKYTRGISTIFGNGAVKIDSFKMRVHEGISFWFEDTIYDPDAIDTVVIWSDYQTRFPGSQLQIFPITKNRARFRFTWKPSVLPGVPIPVLTLRLTDNRCPSPRSRDVNYHIEVRPGLNIETDEITRNDTIIIMKGDSLDLTTNGIGTVNWTSFSGAAVNWSGINRNTWGDTSAIDTNASIRFLPLINTQLLATGEVLTSSNQRISSRDSVYIKVIPPFHIKTMRDTSICSSLDSFQLWVQPDSNYMYNYRWTSDNGLLFNDTVKTPFVSGKIDATYFVEVESHFGGVRRGKIKVSIRQAPQILGIQTSNDTVCTGDTLSMNILNWGIKSCLPLPFSNFPQANKNYQNDTVLNLTNTDTGLSTYPNPFSVRHKASRQQYLYRASEFTSQGISQGSINSIYFHVDSMGNPTTRVFNNFSLRIKCISDTALTSISNTGLITIRNAGNQIIKQGWNKIELDTAYGWDGTSNLLIDICYNTPHTITTPIFTSMKNTTYTANVCYNDSVPVCNSLFLSPSAFNRVPVIRLGLSIPANPAQFQYAWYQGGSSILSNQEKLVTVASNTAPYIAVVLDSISNCTDTVYQSVEVLNLKLKITGDTSACLGASIPLTTSISPTYSGTFSWKPAGRFSTPNAAMSFYQVLSTDSVRVTYKNRFGCELKSSMNIVADSLPNAQLLPLGPFCEQEDSNLLAAQVPGGVFSGIGVRGTYLDASSPALKPGVLTPTSTIVKYVLTQNGCTDSSSTPVLIYHSFDTIYSGPKEFCELDTAVFLKTRHNGGLWSGTGVNNNWFNPVQATRGSHTIDVDSVGFCGNSAQYIFEVYKAPQHDFPTIVYGCDGKPAVLDAGNPGSKYLWNTGDTSQTITALVSGKYWVRIKTGNNCELTDSTEVQVSSNCVGVEQAETHVAQVKIYPNPASKQLNVVLTGFQADHVVLKLLQLDGKVILEKNLMLMDSEASVSMGLSDLAAGQYLLAVSDGNSIKHFKVLIQK